MSDIIRLLPDAIANQIAAGEVVQRPASALKELMENAVDAGSTFVQVLVKEAGKTLIQVIDDGKGMSVTDARMSFERHATSKIRTADDLFAIKTFGFRGEALASIAAVAQVELKTRMKEDELGTFLMIEGSEVKLQEPASCLPGTTIAVKNLFYNIPARRNFLKSNPVEMKHLIDEFLRVVLAYPHIGFSFYQNDMELYKLMGGKLSQRIVGVFGKTYQEQIVPCEEDSADIKIRGYVGNPENVKKTRGEQYLFVNNRFIKNNYLHHAICNAYDGLIPSDMHPFYVLFLDIDPARIDINVHPTKTEIKFDDERTVYGVLRSAVKQALGAHHVVPVLDFNFDVNFTENWKHDESKKESWKNENSFERATVFKKKSAEGWENLLEGFQRISEDQMLTKNTTEFESDVLTFSSKANTKEEELVSKENPYQSGATFQVELTYIVAQMSSGMLMVDQQAAHERIMYEKYIKQLQNSSGVSQQCLFPQQIKLSIADFSLVMDIKEELTNLGFIIEDFGKETLLIQGVPADIHVKNEKVLFEGLIEQFKMFKSELSIDNKENLARSMARRSAIKKGARLTNEEMEMIVGQLFACQNPNYGLSGNKTFVKLDITKINALFNR
jgi:DNA mismatch repair protein MutL